MEVQQIIHILSGEGDQSLFREAEAQLNAVERDNPPLFLHAMAQQLANEGICDVDRQFAGICIKNAVSSNDPTVDKEKGLLWMKIDGSIRGEIKEMVVATLGTEMEMARRSAAQVLSAIGVIELEYEQWPQLIGMLLELAQGGTLYQRHGTLEALGFLCDSAKENTISDAQAEDILATIATGLSDDAPLPIRSAAIVALSNSVDYLKGSFANEKARDYIVKTVGASCASSDPTIQEASFECLSTIVMLYYDVMPAYMSGIYDLTMQAMNHGSDAVALQGIEVWSSVCDEEIEILDLLEDPLTPDDQKRVCHNFVRYAVTEKPEFLPTITSMLTKQQDAEYVDEEEWTPAMAAGACLSLIAGAVGDDIVPRVMPFVYENVNHDNWRCREAAALAFGSILDGPQGEDITDIMEKAIPAFLDHMNDPSVQVKDTTAWTLGRIVQFHPHTIDNFLYDLVNALGDALTAEPRVASNAAWAIHNIADTYAGDCDEKESPLTPYFGDLMEALMTTSDRDDADECGLRNSAYESMNSLILAVPEGCLPQVELVLPLFMNRLSQTFGDDTDQEEANQLQACISSVITSIAQRLGGGPLRPFANDLMELMFMVFEAKSNTVQEEAFAAVGAIAQAFESDFKVFYQRFHPYLVRSLRNWEEASVCFAAVGVVSDMARCMGHDLAEYAREILGALLDNVAVPAMRRDVKVITISCIGDIALAIGGHFQPYLKHIMDMLQDVSQTTVNDPDLIEFLNRLREAVLDAYVGIIQGLKDDNQAGLFLPYLKFLLEFIEYIWNDQTIDKKVVKNIVGIIGDIAVAFGRLDSKVKAALGQPIVEDIISKAFQMRDKKISRLASWAFKEIKKLP